MRAAVCLLPLAVLTGCAWTGQVFTRKDAGHTPPVSDRSATAEPMIRPVAHDQPESLSLSPPEPAVPLPLPAPAAATPVVPEPVAGIATGPPNYLQFGPAFSANPPANSPRGLAQQIQRLTTRNQQLAEDLDDLKGRLTRLERELGETRNRAEHAQQAWQQGQADLAATARTLEAQQTTMENALRALQANEQIYLRGLDSLLTRLRKTVSTYQEASDETDATDSK
jgi:hypothetical protein